MKVFVAGANGFVGKALVMALTKLKEVDVVYCLSRKKGETRSSSKLKYVVNDINNQIAEVSNCDVVINCAGEKIKIDQMYRVNVDGAFNLFNLSNSGGVKVYIHLSSVGSYGASRYAGRVNETSQCSPVNAYETTKYIAESKILSAKKRSDLRLIVIQPSNIINPSDENIQVFPGLLRMIRFGYAPKVLQHDGWLNFISLQLVIDKILLFIYDETVKNRVILNCPIKYTDATILMSNSMRKKLKFLPVPMILERTLEFLIKKWNVNFNFLKKLERQLYELNNNRYFESSIESAKVSVEQTRKMYMQIAKNG